MAQPKRNKRALDKREFENVTKNLALRKKQQDLFNTIKNNTLTVCHGPAGSSKTFVACYTALNLLANRKVDKIILTKPIKESGEQLGHLPGTIDEKVDPFMKSYLSNFEKIIGKSYTDILINNEEILIEPLAYMRGNTYDNAIMLLDESQNCNMYQLMLWATRIGENSKAVMMGDTSQYDIRTKDAKFMDFINMVKGLNNSKVFEFKKEDIVRNKFLIQLVDKYEKYKEENNIN